MREAPYAIRRSPRFRCLAQAELNLQDGMCVPAQLSELSARGCYIDALRPIAVGTEMRLSICYGADICELSGRVIYKHSGGGTGLFGIGVLFRDMGTEQHHVIQSWLSQLAGQPTAVSAQSGERDGFCR